MSQLNQAVMFPMVEVNKQLAEIFTNRINITPYSASRNNIVDTLKSVIRNKRLHLVSKPQDMADVWAVIRNQTIVLDFICDVQTRLAFVLSSSPISFEYLQDQVAYALSRNYAQQNSVADQDFLARVANPNDFTPLVRANAWFVIVWLLLGMTELLEDKAL